MHNCGAVVGRKYASDLLPNGGLTWHLVALRARNDNNFDVFGYDRREGGWSWNEEKKQERGRERQKQTVRFLYFSYMLRCLANLIRSDDANQCVLLWRYIVLFGCLIDFYWVPISFEQKRDKPTWCGCLFSARCVLGEIWRATEFMPCAILSGPQIRFGFDSWINWITDETQLRTFRTRTSERTQYKTDRETRKTIPRKRGRKTRRRRLFAPSFRAQT